MPVNPNHVQTTAFKIIRDLKETDDLDAAEATAALASVAAYVICKSYPQDDWIDRALVHVRQVIGIINDFPVGGGHGDAVRHEEVDPRRD